MTVKINTAQSMPTRQRAVAGIGITFVKIEDLANKKTFSRQAYNNRHDVTLQRMKYSDILRDKIRH